MRKNFSKIMALALMLGMSLVSNTAVAQRHFYKRIEIGGGNLWSFFGAVTTSMIINEMTHQPLTESTLRFGVPNSDYGNLYGLDGMSDLNGIYDKYDENGNEEDNMDFAKASARHLFSHVLAGMKMGYLTDYQGALNLCLYGSAYYNIRQFKLMEDYGAYTRLNTQRVQLGGGLMLTLGSIEKKNRFVIDAGLRYNIPAYFSGEGIEGGCNDIMNKGISSHYMLKWTYNNSNGIGFTMDMMHYNLFKDESLCGGAKVMEFGITCFLLFDAL